MYGYSVHFLNADPSKMFVSLEGNLEWRRPGDGHVTHGLGNMIDSAMSAMSGLKWNNMLGETNGAREVE